ncbi:MAG: phosphate ABC transporter substrate-binding protein PstS [Alphaproteobacteria bacterium]|nr:MAG: phosphate ABC transporter substrate-binding protein PstS [Alphaproteobacteria bacterium]
MLQRIYYLAAVFVLGLLFAAPARAGEVKQINGAGATFPYPIYSAWAKAYEAKTGIRLNYQSIGSGGGIKQIKSKTVDFGASDAPMKPSELEKYGLIQWPQIMGGVVPVVNLPGLKPGGLRLDGRTLADIFLGHIRKWNDPAIAALNPGLDLPDMRITVVHRADGSGTTFIFTSYLAKVSDTWRSKVGNAKAVSWPTGIGGKGNEGVASYVKRIKGGIGYVEYAYAVQNRMQYALMKNREGHFVAPTVESFQAAAAGADWAHAKGYYLILTDQPGAESWPITGASFILVYADANKPERTRAVLKFFDWAFHHGQKMAIDLHYVPMPDKIVKMVERTWTERIRDPKGAPVWK